MGFSYVITYCWLLSWRTKLKLAPCTKLAYTKWKTSKICVLWSVDFSEVRFITPSLLTHDLLFYFPIVFGISLIHFFNGQNILGLGWIWSLGFRSLVALLALFQRVRTKSANFFICNGKTVNSLQILAPPWWPIEEGRDGRCEGRNEKGELWQGKTGCKLMANFSATMVTSFPSVCLSVCHVCIETSNLKQHC